MATLQVVTSPQASASVIRHFVLVENAAMFVRKTLGIEQTAA